MFYVLGAVQYCAVLLLILVFLMFIFERERERERASTSRAEEDVGSEAGSVSTEPDVGLKLTSREIMT